MKICMFTNTYLPHVGGVARSVSAFAADLRKSGNQVLVVAPTFEQLNEDNEDEQHVLRVPAIQHFNGSDFSVRIPLPGVIEDEINIFEPDIIHSHHPFLLGDAALRTARRHDLPIIFTHHTLYEQYTHYVPFDSEPLKRFVINLSTEYANLCSRVIAPSRSVHDLLLKRGVKRPVVVLPTGIDTSYFRSGDGELFRREHGIKPDSQVIGHVGRLAREKNLPFLAAAVAEYMKDHPRAVFVVAGKGDAEKDIRNIFAGHQLSERLIMPGILRQARLGDCYRAMDLFTFASRSETQGLVLMEAMAAGVPVIAIQASGVDDVVEDGHNGRSLRADVSVDEFSAAIGDALTGNVIADWRKNALDTAERFSREKCAAGLHDLYESAIDRGKGPKIKSDVLDTLRKNLRIEWELLQEKAAAMKNSLAEEQPGR